MSYKANVFSFHPPIENPYREAFEYLKNESFKNYSPGAIDYILKFDKLKSKFHSIINVTKPTYPSSNYWKYDEAWFDTDFQIVYYQGEGYYYEIIPNGDKIKEYIIKISTISLFVGVLLILITYFALRTKK